MNLFKQYKSSEYIFLFSILVLSLLLGTYFSFYAFLWRDIESKVTGFSKTHHMNYHEGMYSNNTKKSLPKPGESGKFGKDNHTTNAYSQLYSHVYKK